MVKVAELLAAGQTMSFEFFPPRTDEAERALEKAIGELAPLEPSFASVTYGALGSTKERTREVVIRMNRDQVFPCVAHLTCVGHTRSELVALLDEYAANGVENILALGGDPPADGSPVSGDFTYASELVALVREHPGGFGVGVAAHPELHPRSADRAGDRERLARKLQDADYGITQFFFDVADYVRMVDELDALGCTTPVIPSVMPLISAAGVRRMAGMNGSTIPAALGAELDRRADDQQAILALGVEVATDLCQQLLEVGVPGLHLYALNRSESVREIYANLGLHRGD
jgi:methylenetetrahydrofolate reductase (NADPH)